MDSALEDKILQALVHNRCNTPEGLDHNSQVHWLCAAGGYRAYKLRLEAVGESTPDWNDLPFHVQDAWFIAAIAIDALRIPVMAGTPEEQIDLIEEIADFKLPLGAISLKERRKNADSPSCDHRE